jgi:hypothetical protein
VIYELKRIRHRCSPASSPGHEYWDPHPQLPADCKNKDSFYIDAAIAVMDIGLLMLKRRIRLSRHKWSCSSATCPPTADIAATFHDLMKGLLNVWYLDGWDWIESLFHEQLDGSTHPLRLTCLKVVNLPSLLPPLSPNAEIDKENEDEEDDRVGAVFRAIKLVLESDQLPDLTSNPVSGLEDIKL